MASVAFALRPFGRIDSTNLLLLTAVAFLAYDPGLSGDFSFLLSFSATLGLCRFSEPLSRKLAFLPERFGIREAVGTTLAATLATLPMSVAAFSAASAVSVPANAAVAATVLPVALASVAAAFAEWAEWFGPATVFAFPGYCLLSFVNFVARLGSELPYGYVEWSGTEAWSAPALAVFALVLSLSVMLRDRVPRESGR